MPSPSAAPLRLAPEERARLEQMVRSPSTRQAIARRATIVLRAASGEANAAIARHLGVSRSAVSRWRARFLESGFRGLEDEPRTGAPRQIPADRLACVLR
ncbi:MAG: helix-turn-helix domain-containing protein, partial [Planctomycetota bacterium]